MSIINRYRSALAMIGVGALVLALAIAVPGIAKKKPKKKKKVVAPVTRVLVEGPPVVFNENQATGNGGILHKTVDVTCPPGFSAVGYGGRWSPDRGTSADGSPNGGEFIETGTFVGTQTVHFRVATDLDNDDPAVGPSTFVGQVTCLK